MPFLLIGTIIFTFTANKDATLRFLTNEKQLVNTADLMKSLNAKEVKEIKSKLIEIDVKTFEKNDSDVEAYLSSLSEKEYKSTLVKLDINENQIYSSGFSLFANKIPTYIFFIIAIVLTILSITHNLSLIPMLGLVSCLYMMSELKLSNWVGFGIWLIAGLVIYFLYGRKNSKLNESKSLTA
jgi:uncharacterized membrane protein